MPQPQTFHWTTGLHALAEADERTWLDQWTRGHINPTTLQTHGQPAPTPAVPALTLAGSTR